MRVCGGGERVVGGLVCAMLKLKGCRPGPDPGGAGHIGPPSGVYAQKDDAGSWVKRGMTGSIFAA
jgi:hypothetical protein